MFRPLKASEIDVRVQSITEKGAILLLYKDARADMIILDETVGPMNWQRSHSRDNQNCTVSIFDEKKNAWVCKEDTGTESNTEKEKGLASDSFKRACFNWGIGRELYTSPFIFVSIDKIKTYEKNNKLQTYDKFEVSKIEYAYGSITKLVIINQNGKEVYSYKYASNSPQSQVNSEVDNTTTQPQKHAKQANTGQKTPQKAHTFITPEQAADFVAKATEHDKSIQLILDYFKLSKLEDMTIEQYNTILAKWSK